MKNKPIRMVCPRNGETVECPLCKLPTPHHVEQLGTPGDPPVCTTHVVKMVPA